MENRVSTCHIVVDSLYGSLKLVQELKSIGIDTVAKCRADRPAWIFATNVKKLNEVHKTPCVGQWASMGGELPGGNQILRLHYSCEPPRKGPHIYAHLISTVHSPTDHGCLKEAISRGVEEKNGERHTEEAMRADACTGVLSTYNKTAGYIDRVNSRIVGALPAFRWTRWKSKFLVFLLIGMCSNAHRLENLYYEQFLRSVQKDDPNIDVSEVRGEQPSRDCCTELPMEGVSEQLEEYLVCLS